MPQWLKIFAVLLCLMMPFMNEIVRVMRPDSTFSSPRPAMRGHGTNQETTRQLQLAMLVLAEVGAIVLLIDAFLRKYDAPRAWPLAIALMGLITFGMMSLVYFAIWGWRPARSVVAWADDFCDACRAETSDQSLRGAGMHNMLGTSFLGHSSLCRTCGSSVRTLWLWILLPIVPLGSYRVLPAGDAMAHKSWFKSRRAPLAMFQIALCYSVVAAVVFAFWWLLLRNG